LAHRIPWFRVFAEGVVIVASILLAFGIDAWWDQRQEDDRIQATLSSVAAEIAANESELRRAIDGNEESMQRLLAFLLATPEEVGQSPTYELRAITASVVRGFGFDPGGGALDNLLTSGDLALISDPDLRAALVRWRQLPDEIEEDLEAATQAARTAQQLLHRHGVYTAQFSAGPRGPIPDALPLNEALAAARRDPETVDAITLLGMVLGGLSLELRSFLPLASELLSQLES